MATRFACLALDCVTREFPNKIAHVLNNEGDVRAPRDLTPAFYGCYDWHSAVHGHWMLARLARMYPAAAFSAEAARALDTNLTPERLAREAEYLRARPGFERPYGLAWLLALDLERSVGPLAPLAVEHVSTWLPKLAYPDRSGQHANTAFAMGLMLDWARARRHHAFTALLEQRALHFFRNDQDAPIRWEPSGEDFLSPALSEADLLRRVLPPAEFQAWLRAFLPDVSSLRPVHSADRTDGKLAHADGLNLSRAWMLHSLGFEKEATEHAEAGLANIGAHYMGTHWLGTFAVYLLTTINGSIMEP